ncbi:ABC transporter ATP-binding protein [Candidatus Zixiibacteriota bacterium]
MISGIPVRLEAENPAIRTEGLIKDYKRTRALSGLDLTVPEGAVYLLVGPNGSGKTTSMKILLDLVRSNEGTAEVFGLSPIDDGATVRAQIGYVPEGRIPGYEWMKVGHLIRHHATYYPSWDMEYAGALIQRLEIDERAKFKSLSKGEARRVQLLLALAHRPPLLLLDEPMDGLDPLIRDRVVEQIVDHISENPTTVLASTHHIQEMEKLADHMGVLHDGRLLAQSTRDDLHQSLRRYRLEVPEGWVTPDEFFGALIHQNGSGPEVAWAIWGEEEEVTSALTASGATVRNVSALQLEEAAIALLAGKEGA